MKKNNKRHLRSLAAVLLSLALVAGAIFMTSASTKTWKVKFTKTAGTSALGYTAYRAMQGIGFDTYSGKDGYEFVQSDDKKTYSLIHFTMEDNGWCTRVKKLPYTLAQVGHANDATVYKDANGNKWLFVALFGEYDETISGVSANLRVIKLSEYNSGTKKVYNCNVNEVKNAVSSVHNITGITYEGKTYLNNGKKVPTFIISSGNTMVEAYLTQSGTTMTFHPTDTSRRKGRIVKPVQSSGKVFLAQGIAYHNNYVYMSFEGSDGTSDVTRTVVTRISLDELFTSGDHQMEVFNHNYKTDNDEKKTFAKHGPEAVFFTSLDKKSNVYIGVNRQIKDSKGKIVDDDAIMRSAVRY